LMRVSAYVLVLGLLIGLISGAVFASDSADITQHAATSTLSGTTVNQASLVQDGADRGDRHDGSGDRGDRGRRGDRHGHDHGHFDIDYFGDIDNPVLLLFVTVAILILLL